MTYHVNITNFLFAHTISEVLDGVAFVLLFAAAVQKGVVAASSERGAHPASPPGRSGEAPPPGRPRRRRPWR